MLKTFLFNKMVREKQYKKNILDKEVCTVTKTLSQEELIGYFKLKILEEASEVVDATSEDNLIEELADCVEVIRGFAHVLGIGFDTVERVRKIKREERGGFEEGIVIDTVTAPENHHIGQYCLASPDKYPEIKKS